LTLGLAALFLLLVAVCQIPFRVVIVVGPGLAVI